MEKTDFAECLYSETMHKTKCKFLLKLFSQLVKKAASAETISLEDCKC